MLRWLRRILVVIAILIAVTVLLPLAYIEGACRPEVGPSAASAPAVTLPAIDEAVASADLGTVAVGPLWWDRFGNMVGFMLHNGITDSTEIRNAVMRNALPGVWNKNGVGIDELRTEVRAAIADAKQAPPEHPNG